MHLSSTEIKVKLLRRGVTAAELARQWGVPKENLSRVIHRTPGFVFPDIRRRLAEFLGVPVESVGRDLEREQRKAA
jgi:lambda repressor-like predicted transcriptional regulator